MKKKSEIIEKIASLVSLFIAIIFGCFVFFCAKSESYSLIDTIILGCVWSCPYGIAIYGLFEIKLINPMKIKEMNEEALQEIKQAMNGYDCREVCYLFLENSDKKIQDLAYMVKYKDYRFIAKLTDDNTIDLIVVDKDNKEICRKKISNPVFFITNFKFI